MAALNEELLCECEIGYVVDQYVVTVKKGSDVYCGTLATKDFLT